MARVFSGIRRFLASRTDALIKTNDVFTTPLMVRYSERMVHSIAASRVGAQISAYLDDTYLEQVDTRVIAVGETDGAPWAAVERCLFHPQGGGSLPTAGGWGMRRSFRSGSGRLA